MNCSKIDLRLLNSDILVDWCLTLHNLSLPKNVLRDFVQKTKVKLSTEVLNKIISMTKEDKDSFLERLKSNTCPDFGNPKCGELPNRLSGKFKNLHYDKDKATWHFKKKNSDIISHPPTPITKFNGEEHSTPSPQFKEITAHYTKINEFLNADIECNFSSIINEEIVDKFFQQYYSHLKDKMNKCETCIQSKNNENCSYTCANNNEIIKLMTVFFQAMSSSKSDILYFLNNDMCKDPKNIQIMTLFMKQVYYPYMNCLMKNIINRDEGIPIFFSLRPNYYLELEEIHNQAMEILVYSHDAIEIESFGCKHILLDLLIYHCDDLIISQVENPKFVAVVADFQNNLYTSKIESFQIFNFSNDSIQIEPNTALFALKINSPLNNHCLLRISNRAFGNLQDMTMQKTANMSTEFLSSILCNQFLKMVSPKATDIQNFNTEINEEIIKNFQEISQSMPLEQLFYLLMYKTTDGSLIDKKLFLQSQKCSFPKVFEKVMNKKTSLYELRDGLLYKKIQNNFKLMLPGILIKNTFLRFHNKDLHDFDSYILQKLRENCITI